MNPEIPKLGFRLKKGALSISFLFIFSICLNNQLYSQIANVHVGVPLKFNGTSDHHTVKQKTSVLNGNAWTIEMWVKGSPQDNKFLYSENNSVAPNDALFGIHAKNSNIRIIWRNDQGKYLVDKLINQDNPPAIFDNNWHHIALVQESPGKLEFRIDGWWWKKLQYTPSGTCTFDQITIGAIKRSQVISCFNGTMSELRVWKIARNDIEIRSDKLCNLNGNEKGLVHLFPWASRLNRSFDDYIAPNTACYRYFPASNKNTHFDGEKDFIQLKPGVINGNSSFTFECWVKVPRKGTQGLGEREMVGTLFGYNKGGNEASLMIKNDGNLMVKWGNDCEFCFNGSTDLRDNQWHHIAFVRSTGVYASNPSIKIYIDGKLEVERSKPGKNISFETGHIIGGDQLLENGFPFHGEIDEVRIYSKARSLRDLIGCKDRQLSSGMGADCNVADDDLEAYYQLRYNTTDLSNNGKHGYRLGEVLTDNWFFLCLATLDGTGLQYGGMACSNSGYKNSNYFGDLPIGFSGWNVAHYSGVGAHPVYAEPVPNKPGSYYIRSTNDLTSYLSYYPNIHQQAEDRNVWWIKKDKFNGLGLDDNSRIWTFETSSNKLYRIKNKLSQKYFTYNEHHFSCVNLLGEALDRNENCWDLKLAGTKVDEQNLWDFAKGIGTIASFQKYIQFFNNFYNRPEAASVVWNALKDQLNWPDLLWYVKYLSSDISGVTGADDKVWTFVNKFDKDRPEEQINGGTPEAYDFYIKLFPNGRHTKEAYLQKARKAHKIKYYEEYLVKYPNQSTDVQYELDDLRWQIAENIGTPKAYYIYLTENKSGWTRKAERIYNANDKIKNYNRYRVIVRIPKIIMWNSGSDPDNDVEIKEESGFNYQINHEYLGEYDEWKNIYYGTPFYKFPAEVVLIGSAELTGVFTQLNAGSAGLKNKDIVTIRTNKDFQEDDILDIANDPCNGEVNFLVSDLPDDRSWKKYEIMIKCSDGEEIKAEVMAAKFDHTEILNFGDNDKDFMCPISNPENFETPNMEKGPGFVIRNETDYPIDFSLEQVGPLYYGIIMPGKTITRHTGAVWFTQKAAVNITGQTQTDDWDCVKPVVQFTGSVILGALTAGTSSAAAGAAGGSWLPATYAAISAKASAVAAKSVKTLVIDGVKTAAQKLSENAMGQVVEYIHSDEYIYAKKAGCYAGLPWPSTEPLKKYKITGGPKLPCIDENGNIIFHKSTELKIEGPLKSWD